LAHLVLFASRTLIVHQVEATVQPLLNLGNFSANGLATLFLKSFPDLCEDAPAGDPTAARQPLIQFSELLDAGCVHVLFLPSLLLMGSE
jgi:hypothetical protein